MSDSHDKKTKKTMRKRTYKMKTQKSTVSLDSRYARLKKKFEEFEDFVEFEFEQMCSGEKSEPDWERMETMRNDVYHQMELMYSTAKEK